MIDDQGDEVICSLPGRFKKKFHLKQDKQYILDIATIGDRIKFTMNQDGTGVINKILERKNHFSRKAIKLKGTAGRGERLEQIFAANIDNIVIITSISNPKFNNRLLDRILVAAESSKINASIVINKVDLESSEQVEEWSELYSDIGYQVHLASAAQNEGLFELKSSFEGEINLFCGASGVGKSSILNSLYPKLDLKVGDISSSSLRGKHTTVSAILQHIDNKTVVIDTPGIREFAPYGIEKQDLAHYFIEFLPYVNNCKFNTCTHFHEPGCAVVEAVEEEEIDIQRYYSYLNLLETIEDDVIY